MSGYKIKFNGIDRLYQNYEKELNNLSTSVWKSGLVLTGKDNIHSERFKLENNIAKYTGRKYALAVQSGTDALYFALKSYGIGTGKKVVCPAYSFLATATAIKRTGAEIIFVDTNEKAQIGNFDFFQNIDAVVYVNLFGNLADYERLDVYCKKNKIPLIEDGAQSLGALYKGIPSGKLGDISTLSFSPTKNLPAFGNGGIVLTDDKNVAETIKSLRYHGSGEKVVSYGYNSIMSEDHCAQVNFLLSQYDILQNKRQQVRECYDNELDKLGIESIRSIKDTVSSNHKLVIIVDMRDELQKFLSKNNIETQIHYKTILPYTSYFGSKDNFPFSIKISQKALTLPLYPHLTIEEVKYICQKLKEFYGI